jgi:hypothetical protein
MVIFSAGAGQYCARHTEIARKAFTTAKVYALADVEREPAGGDAK